MKIFPHGNAGPHDPELVDLLIKAILKYQREIRESNHPDENLTQSMDFLNLVVDNINDLFGEELEKAWMYDEVSK